jgi:hypothetical protein
MHSLAKQEQSRLGDNRVVFTITASGVRAQLHTFSLTSKSLSFLRLKVMLVVDNTPHLSAIARSAGFLLTTDSGTFRKHSHKVFSCNITTLFCYLQFLGCSYGPQFISERAAFVRTYSP